MTNGTNPWSFVRYVSDTDIL